MKISNKVVLKFLEILADNPWLIVIAGAFVLIAFMFNKLAEILSKLL